MQPGNSHLHNHQSITTTSQTQNQNPAAVEREWQLGFKEWLTFCLTDSTALSVYFVYPAGYCASDGCRMDGEVYQRALSPGVDQIMARALHTIHQ